MPRPADPTTRSTLVAAALREFSAVGMHRARIEDITAHSGVSKGAFYLHFQSKEALFEEVLSGFQSRMETLSNERMAAMETFIASNGALTAADFALLTPRGQAFATLEAMHDRLVLEKLWEERHLFDVLLRGCKGTRFDGLVWEITTREVERVQQDYERLKAAGCCRDDIPSDVFASVLVGAWLMIARKMASAEEKPDFEGWLASLHRLIREGAAPRNAASLSDVSSQAVAVAQVRSAS
jgi:AcrR family transcriptional regulator